MADPFEDSPDVPLRLWGEWPSRTMDWSAGELARVDPTGPVDPMDHVVGQVAKDFYPELSVQDAVDFLSGKYAPKNPPPAKTYLQTAGENIASGAEMIGRGFARGRQNPVGFATGVGQTLMGQASSDPGVRDVLLGAVGIASAPADAAIDKFIGQPIYRATGTPPVISDLIVGGFLGGRSVTALAKVPQIANEVRQTARFANLPDELSIVLDQGLSSEWSKVYRVQDWDGKTHYSIRLDRIGNRAWDVGYVHNETGQYQNLAPAIYRDMARQAALVDEKFVAGVMTNQTSERLHQQLVRMGYARQMSRAERKAAGEGGSGDLYRSGRDVAMWEILPEAQNQSDLSYLWNVWRAQQSYNMKQFMRARVSRGGTRLDWAGPRMRMTQGDTIEVWDGSPSSEIGKADIGFGEAVNTSRSPRVADRLKGGMDSAPRKIRINGRPDMFIDAARPLSLQSDYVRSRLNTLMHDLRGRTVDQLLADMKADKRVAADVMKTGIRGVRYRSAGPTKEAASTNYSVWDKKYVEPIPDSEWTQRDFLEFYLPTDTQVKKVLGVGAGGAIGAGVTADDPVQISPREAARIISGYD